MGASAAKLAATVLDRAERRTKSGNKMGIVQLSDQSGQYEAILFQEGLNQYRDLLERGSAVLLTLNASLEGEDVRARIATVESLDHAATRMQKGLRILLRDSRGIAEIARKLTGRGEGEVTLVLPLPKDNSEVEIKLPGRYPINPHISGAIQTLPGVVDVELI
jgi:DNA polymerase-3 subunit alpha